MITIGTGRRGRPVKKEAERQAAIYAAMRESYRQQREQTKEAQIMASLDAVDGTADVSNDNLNMDDNMLNSSNRLRGEEDGNLDLQNLQQVAIDRLETIKVQSQSTASPNFPISQKSNSKTSNLPNSPGTLKSNTSAASLYDKLKQASSNNGLPSMILPSMPNFPTKKSGNKSFLSNILDPPPSEPISMNSNLVNTLNSILGNSSNSNARQNTGNNGSSSEFQMSPSMTSPGNVNGFNFKSVNSPNQIPVSNSSSGLSSINRSPESGPFQMVSRSEQNLNQQNLIPQQNSLNNQIGTADSGISHPLSNIGSADNAVSNGRTIPMNPSHNWSTEQQQQQSDTRSQLLQILSQSNGDQPDEVVSKDNLVLQPKEEAPCRRELSTMLLNLNKNQQPPN
jgi:hypothetical protein